MSKMSLDAQFHARVDAGMPERDAYRLLCKDLAAQRTQAAGSKVRARIQRVGALGDRERFEAGSDVPAEGLRFIQLSYKGDSFLYTNRGGIWHEYTLLDGDGPKEGDGGSIEFGIDPSLTFSEDDGAILAALISARFDKIFAGGNGLALGDRGKAKLAATAVKDVAAMTPAQKKALLGGKAKGSSGAGKPVGPDAGSIANDTTGSSGEEAVAVFGVIVLLSAAGYALLRGK